MQGDARRPFGALPTCRARGPRGGQRLAVRARARPEGRGRPSPASLCLPAAPGLPKWPLVRKWRRAAALLRRGARPGPSAAAAPRPPARPSTPAQAHRRAATRQPDLKGDAAQGLAVDSDVEEHGGVDHG